MDDTLQLGHAGRLVGKFRLDRKLGSGAMGEVFLGVHVELGNAVAVKILNVRATAEANGVERFLNEARAVAAIDHENIARVIDLDRLPDGTPYIVMEYVAGQTLREYLHERGPLPIQTVLELGLDILGALKAAHDRGVVHRDLKPENIRITPAGRAKVLDFGIAKRLNTPTPALTADGVIIGTPHYMSPEQISGPTLDGRADLYSLGVILYECLTGERPFEAESLVGLLNKQLTEAPRGPTALRPDAPPELELAILRSLEKSADFRFSSAEEMAQVLRTLLGKTTGPHAMPLQGPQRALATPEVSASPTSPMTQQSTTRTPIVLGTVVLLAATAALVGFAVVGKSSAPIAPVAVVVQPPAPQPVDAAVEPTLVPTTALPVPVDEPVVDTKLPPRQRPPSAPRVNVKASNVVPAQPPPAAVAEAPQVVDAGPARRKDRELLPIDFNPKSFDPLAYLARASRLARERMDDAALIDFSVDGVFVDGHVDLTLARGYEANYYFRSPKKSVDDPLLPDDDEEIPCLTYVVVSAKAIEVFTAKSFHGCKEKFLPPITCPLPRAAQKAQEQGGIPDRVAKASWLLDGWFFDYGDDGPVVSVKCK